MSEPNAADTEEDTDSGSLEIKSLLVESFGGWRGMVDAGLPVVVFILANSLSSLSTAVWAALGAGAVLLVVRLIRRESVQQAISGFIGVALAAYIAHRMGQAKGFFLPGIVMSYGLAGIFAVSVLVRRPLVGLVWEYVQDGIPGWRQVRPLNRAYLWCTLMWTGIFLFRGLVQGALYQSDRTGWLAAARLLMGYPLTGLGLAVTYFVVRRIRNRVLASRIEQPAS